MGQTGNTQDETLQRFEKALGELEGHLTAVFAEDSGENPPVLKEQVKSLSDERDRLSAELEAERARVRRLKAANEEVSGRLEDVMGTLKEIDLPLKVSSTAI